jgi:hypothetical protein
LELADARQRIAEKPNVGSVYAVRAGGVIVRRVLMPKTKPMFSTRFGMTKVWR